MRLHGWRRDSVGDTGDSGDGGGEDGDIRLERFIERAMRRFV